MVLTQESVYSHPEWGGWLKFDYENILKLRRGLDGQGRELEVEVEVEVEVETLLHGGF